MLFRTATVLIITWAGSSLCAQTPTDDHDQLQQILEARIDTEKRLTTIKNQLNNLQAKNLKLDKQLLNIPPQSNTSPT